MCFSRFQLSSKKKWKGFFFTTDTSFINDSISVKDCAMMIDEMIFLEAGIEFQLRVKKHKAI